jgi:hypothetical protein
LRESSWLEDTIGDRIGACYLRSIFDKCVFEKIDTWAIRAFYASITNGCLNVLPNANLVSNIGFATDSHSGVEHHHYGNIPVKDMEFPLEHPPFFLRDFIADRRTFLDEANFNDLASKKSG